MFRQAIKKLSAGLLALTLTSGLLLAQAKEKKVKDQGEYDLFTAVTKEQDPGKKLALLNQWKEKYPDSDFKDDRLKLILTAYQQLGKPAEMYATAKELQALDPKEVTALYWLTLLTESLPPTPDTLSTGEKAAQALLSAEKPAPVKPEDWEKMQKEFGAIAHKTLGFIATQNKDFKKAEEEYTKVLQMNPNFAQVSYALGMAIYQQKDPKRQSEVLYHFARAASLTGTGELQGAQKKAIDDFFVKAYTNYHGPEGMAELRKTAMAGAFPPAGFTIKNKAEIEAEQQAQFASEHPGKALFETIKAALLAPDGQQYFDEKVKGAKIPGGVNGVEKFRAKVVSVSPEKAPKEIVLSVGKSGEPDAKLVLQTPLPNGAEPGTEIQFAGIPSSFTAEPFMITFELHEKDDLTGWPAPPKRAPATKRGVTRKKK